MSARANPTAIGIFVTGATALAVLALLVFGSGRIFRRQETFIIYFNESVNNLSDGSPVKFKGVQIGQVRRITLRYNQATDSSSVPVLIDIDLSRLRNNLGVEINLADEQVFDEQVRLGLRAKLQMQSLLTGLLYIDLDIYDELKDKVPPAIQEVKDYKEIPALPSGLTETMKALNTALQNISQVDLKGISDKISDLLTNLNSGVKDIDFKGISDSLTSALKNLNDLLADPKIQELLAQANSTLKSFQDLSQNANQQLQPISSEVQLTMQRARQTLDQADATLNTIKQMLEPQSPLRFELDQTLEQVSGAGRSIRVLSDYLERNPQALLFGKPGQSDPASTTAPAAAPGTATPASAPRAGR